MSTSDRRRWVPVAAIAGLVVCPCVTAAGIAAARHHSEPSGTHGSAQKTAFGLESAVDSSGTPVQYTKDVVAEGEGLGGGQAAQQVLQGMAGNALGDHHRSPAAIGAAFSAVTSLHTGGGGGI